MSISYELAKELKGGGYLQEGNYWFVKDGYKQWRPFPENRDIVCPTLEELIEACGDSFDTLNKTGEPRWEAGVSDGADGGPIVHHGITYGEGSTPTEAVARLWLALNKK